MKYSEEKPYLSLSIKQYGSEVYFSQVDSIEKLTQMFNSHADSSDLYRQMNLIGNLYLLKYSVQQPLANGVSFKTSANVGLGTLVQQASSKQEKDQNTEFKVNNFYRFGIEFCSIKI